MRILTLEIRLEVDVVLTRQRARQIAGLLGFPLLDQTRIATAASEIARNAWLSSSSWVAKKDMTSSCNTGGHHHT